MTRVRTAGRTQQVRLRGRRSVAEAVGTRERILRHAQRLFARKGYGATSLRELATAAGVRLFTLQHHFGSKQQLYAEIIRRWDREVEALLMRVLTEATDGEHLVADVVDALFDHFLANRPRVALNARAVLGEGVPRRLVLTNRTWVHFVDANVERHRLSGSGLDIGLLLITIEGILHNHVLAAPHYRHLYGRDVTDAAIAARVKRHLTQVILRLLAPEATGGRDGRGHARATDPDLLGSTMTGRGSGSMRRSSKRRTLQYRVTPGR